MLTHLSLQNFILIDEIALDFHQGMTVITGETGAGKSIIIDALDLALGRRIDSKVVRNDCERCQIQVIFDITQRPAALDWLRTQGLDQDTECILRRTITKDNRSRCYINGCSVPLQQVKILAGYLVNIHGQHEHQALLNRDIQCQLLDAYAKHPERLEATREAYQAWHQTNRELQQLQTLSGDEERMALWQYQLDELTTLATQEDEITTLEAEQKQLQHAHELTLACQQAVEVLTTDDNSALTTRLHGLNQQLTGVTKFMPELSDAIDLIQQAHISCQEASDDIQQKMAHLTIDDKRLATIEARMQALHDVARKHQIKPEALTQLQQTLSDRLTHIAHQATHKEQLTEQTAEKLAHYQKAAHALSRSRRHTAQTLSQAISELMQRLGMPNGLCQFDITPHSTPTAHGQDNVDLLVTTNPEQSAQPLGKVASGGELSRISLAVQALTSSAHQIPTLIFDEVDTGISGNTAAIVGQLLQELSQHSQVIVITHLPQVASYGQHHFTVSKTVTKQQTQLQLTRLTKPQRIEELARLLGGIEITAQTRAHAEEMLK